MDFWYRFEDIWSPNSFRIIVARKSVDSSVNSFDSDRFYREVEEFKESENLDFRVNLYDEEPPWL